MNNAATHAARASTRVSIFNKLHDWGLSGPQGLSGTVMAQLLGYTDYGHMVIDHERGEPRLLRVLDALDGPHGYVIYKTWLMQ